MINQKNLSLHFLKYFYKIKGSIVAIEASNFTDTFSTISALSSHTITINIKQINFAMSFASVVV